MTTEETHLFETLDDYARTNRSSFLTEMFLDERKVEYVLCFRPTHAAAGSTNLTSCRYMRIQLGEALKIGQSKTLTASVKEMLDRELVWSIPESDGV